ncbi:metalloendopeptidase OMA1, mitochondrial isoform X1 [Nematostella vectensis]|uniref:metalloendopeptidase OMA1, mitochondrial isoform X1 n=1 Tax=Nematostella vectensis TaxID=45351 RepID=UPI002077943A|nr:metalloendopeptidase OMA1, mitochondrial isoform X1 [Nematostella vectensis]
MALASIRGGKSFRFQLASVCRQLSRDHSSVTSFERNIAVNTHSPFYSRYPGVNRCNGLLRTSCQRSTILNDRGFHTTPHRHAWPVAVLLVKLVGPLSKISKLAAMLGGRTFRRWWQKLPAHHKHKLLTLDLLKKRRTEKLILIGGSTGVFFLAYYVYHLEETPITHRRRFMPVGNAQMRDVIEEEYRQVLEQCGEHILPVNHPYHRRVFEVAQRLVMANRSEEIDGIKWQVNVVDTDDVNAFVLPNGQIFMFVGILRMLPNEGALATILGHEMAHAILRHAAEQASVHGVVNLFVVVLLAILWALIPTDYLALAAQWIQGQILSILLHLPYSRQLEEEADQVGMLLAAKACFDVRESPKVWSRIGAMEEHTKQQSALPEWLSTHPSHANRANKLQALLPEALEIRKECNCPALQDSMYMAPRRDSKLLRLYGT